MDTYTMADILHVLSTAEYQPPLDNNGDHVEQQTAYRQGYDAATIKLVHTLRRTDDILAAKRVADREQAFQEHSHFRARMRHAAHITKARPTPINMSGVV